MQIASNSGSEMPTIEGGSVPATWLTVSHISGPNLVTTIQAVRRGGARVEGPEQTVRSVGCDPPELVGQLGGRSAN